MKKSLFEYESYKEYVRDWTKSLPKQGYGTFQRIAKHLGVSSVSVSHVFNGPRDINLEQALELAEFLGLAALESEYFQILVQRERAGTHKLRTRLSEKLAELRNRAHELKERLPQDKTLDEASRPQFYSSWYYSGIRLLTSIEGYQSISTIAERVNLSPSRVREIIDFLLKHGLCVENAGKIQIGPARTHLESSSPLVSRHHSNWRIKAMQNMEDLKPHELFYTGPMALSLDAMTEIRADLVALIERTVKKVGPSRSETLACLNIDWFSVDD